MTDRSRVELLAQVLLDSIGPRLTGSPGREAAVDWLVKVYQSRGMPARKEQYGTWRAWRRGYTHLDLIAPRVPHARGDPARQEPGTGWPVAGEVVWLVR